MPVEKEMIVVEEEKVACSGVRPIVELLELGKMR